MSGSNQKVSQAALAAKLVAGTQKHLATATQLMVAGGTYTAQQVETQLQTLVTLRAAVDAAKVAVKAKLVDESNQAPALRVFLESYVGFVRAAFSGSPDVLADFGLAPKKAPTPRTAEEQAAANAKSEATRKARGTMSKKKKLAIKGNVTGVVVTPVTEPAPAPVASPAQSAPQNGASH